MWPAEFIAVMSDTARSHSMNITLSTFMLLSQQSLPPAIKLYKTEIYFFLLFLFFNSLRDENGTLS